MKIVIKGVFLAVIWGGLISYGYAKESLSFWESIKNPATLKQLKSFVAAKEAQADAAAKADGKGMPPDYKAFFKAADKGDWLTVSNMFWEMGRANGDLPSSSTNIDGTFRGIRWQALKEIWGAYAAFAEGDEKYSELFGSEIIPSIPPGSIYFGGSDPGRFIITALQKSQIQGAPFYTLTQNALADGSYLDYLKSMYGKEICIPTLEDAQRCFDDYYADVRMRYKNDQVKLGEDVVVNSNGTMQVNGRIAVNEINGLIAKVIFDKETNRQFYVEEDIPMDWMYPYLEPDGLIFKLNHEPLEKLSDEIVERDHDYWSKIVAPIIGGWLKDDTSLTEIATFVNQVFLGHDFNNFQGDRNFEENFYTRSMFAKERAAIAGLYAWRAEHSSDALETKRMDREADFAFRQAWALCPDFSQVVLRYVSFLMETPPRTDDAITITRTCLPMDKYDKVVSNLLANLEQYKKQCDEWAKYSPQISIMENEAKINPTDYTNIFSLAACYLQVQQTNRANQLVEQTISRINVPPEVLRGVAQFFADSRQFPDLEIALEKLTVAVPSEPEARHDLARVEAVLKKDDDAIKDLRTAIRLSDQRLKSNSKAFDVRKAARTDPAFEPIRGRPNFREVVGR